MSKPNNEKRGCRSCNQIEFHDDTTCDLVPFSIGDVPPYPVLDSERSPERKGLMICCMRTVERYGDSVRSKIPAGTIIVCDKCGQFIRLSLVIDRLKMKRDEWQAILDKVGTATWAIKVRAANELIGLFEKEQL